MASDQKCVDFVPEQIENVGEITTKMMFGEHRIYADGKIFALIADNMLFIKPIGSGRAYIGNAFVEVLKYEEAKSSFLIEEKIEDRKWFSELVRISIKEPPTPKPKKKK